MSARAGERLGELGVAFLLTRVEPQILEHEQPARLSAPPWPSRHRRRCRRRRPPDGQELGQAASAAGLRLYFGSAPALGPAEVAHQDQFALRARTDLMVGSAMRIRRSSVICCCSSSGTLKSTRIKTVLFATSTSAMVRLAMFVVIR